MNPTNSKNPKNPLIGAHFSIAKGLHDAIYQAKSYDCKVLQIFTKNATTWKERTLTEAEQERFEQAKKETGIQEIASHASYLINLASPDPKKHAQSCEALKQELIRSSALNIPYCVLHPGAHKDSGVSSGLSKIIESINRIFSDTKKMAGRLLLETMAGQGTGLGHTFEQIAEIIDGIDDKSRVGVCLDTCHIFAAGYDIRKRETYNQVINQFDTILDLSQLFLIHVNDSRKDLASRVDRHAHIGQGKIGLDPFGFIINDERLFHIPKLIETPKGKDGFDWDRQNLNQLRLLFSESYKQ